jgi:hypothetical protein
MSVRSFRCGRCNSLIPDPDDDFIEPAVGKNCWLRSIPIRMPKGKADD